MPSGNNQPQQLLGSPSQSTINPPPLNLSPRRRSRSSKPGLRSHPSNYGHRMDIFGDMTSANPRKDVVGGKRKSRKRKRRRRTGKRKTNKRRKRRKKTRKRGRGKKENEKVWKAFLEGRAEAKRKANLREFIKKNPLPKMSIEESFKQPNLSKQFTVYDDAKIKELEEDLMKKSGTYVEGKTVLKYPKKAGKRKSRRRNKRTRKRRRKRN